jgi:hypothetical protein
MKTIVVRMTVIVECPVCKSTREIEAGDLATGDVPLCKNDGMPMWAKSASRQFVDVEE